jgi:protease-4
MAAMSAADLPPASPPRVLPVRLPPPPPPPPSSSAAGWRAVFWLLLIASLGLNVLIICGGLWLGRFADSEPEGLRVRERYHSGDAKSSDAVAVVRIEGLIMEGYITFARNQIDRAAEDKHVKAVVIRIESPGGTITASDDLHRRLVQLRDGTTPKYADRNPGKKPLVVSMGSLAASGGYYVAMPARKAKNEPKIFAEPTTITGSIGVYASFPDIHKLADKYGVEMKMVKAGDIKGSGSMFHEMTPQERQPWDDMVNHAYDRFLTIVAEGRPDLTKEQLKDEVTMSGEVPLIDDRGNPIKGEDGKPKTAPFSRKRADGGIYTAEEAVEYGLVDRVGTMDDAIAEAAKQAGLTKYRAIVYERPLSLYSALLGGVDTRAGPAELGRLVNGLGPRVWYLLPQAEMSAVLAPLGPN